MHHALGGIAIVALIAFAFGTDTARKLVGTFLIGCALLFAYVMYRIAMGTI